MGKFTEALSIAAKALDSYGARQQKINDLTDQLMRRTYGVDASQARKIAETLIDRADPITWK